MWVFALFIVMLFIAAIIGFIDLFKFNRKTLSRFIFGGGSLLLLNYVLEWNFSTLSLLIFTLIIVGFISWGEWE